MTVNETPPALCHVCQRRPAPRKGLRLCKGCRFALQLVTGKR